MIDQAALTWEEKLTSLFQPDTLLPAQYFETLRRKAQLEPEQRLMLAVLEDGIECFQDNVLARNGRRKKLFEEAEEWILEEDNNWIFSFDNICEVLGLNPQYVRRGLVYWREKERSKHLNARPASQLLDVSACDR